MLQKILNHPTFHQLLKFTAVGFVGMAVDMAVLWLVTNFVGLGPYIGRVVSFVCAATVTWTIHRHFTFRDVLSCDPLWRQWLKFIAANSIGFGVNYGTYVACVTFIGFFAAAPVWAIVPASVAGLLFSFTASKKLVFR
jgi:putative flippase GtrA